jgi:hypothetical protein
MRLTSGISALCVAATLGLAGPAWSATMGLSHSGNPGWSLPPHQRGGDGGRIRPASEAISYANVEVCGCEPCAAEAGSDVASAEGRSGSRSASAASKFASSNGFAQSGNGRVGGQSQGASAAGGSEGEPDDLAGTPNGAAPNVPPGNGVRRRAEVAVPFQGEEWAGLSAGEDPTPPKDGDGAVEVLMTPVPVPATLPLALAGFGVLALVGRKRRG